MIFYADDSNIYLIADDYIPYDYIPSNSSGNKPVRGSTSCARGAYFAAPLMSNYSGSASITDARLKALNSQYTMMSTSPNMSAVAYMLDTNAWSVYAGEDAEYAIGGPSLELFVASYNEKYLDDKLTTSVNTYGYNINGKFSYNLRHTTDSLYVINSKNNARAMWFASPSAHDGHYLMYVNYNGDMSYTPEGSTDLGFRPIVCLKSDVRLQDNGDGTYTIK